MSAPGCDDAPVVTVGRGGAKRVTFVYPYYENAGMLSRQIAHWAGYREALRRHLSVIVVDDGSPSPARVPWVPFPLRLFRIEVDVRWNWLAARNIGMHHASGWCLLTDMDHMVPEATLESLVHGEHDPGTVYRFSRREHTGEKIHEHPNSWFMTREMFWRIGGYDEALSGHYGTDGEYRRRVAKTAPVRILADELVRHERIGDSSTTRYARKQPEDAVVQKLVRERGKGWRPKVLSFPYREVCA